MDSKLFSIGDIVTLKAHPFNIESTGIIISGDHIMLAPLMVVVEIFKVKQRFAGCKSDTYKYKCAWFSPKPYKFIYAEIEEEDLKSIVKCTTSINKNNLKRGDKVVFKTASIELCKKKSSLTYEDNSVNAGIGNTLINSLLSFLPPVLQVVDYQEHKTKHALTDKAQTQIRNVSSIDVKFNFFDPTNDKISNHTLPLEALELIVEVDLEVISLLSKCIDTSGYVRVQSQQLLTLCKPHNIAYRGGYYFLRAYDYLSNKVEEFEILASTVYTRIKTPFTDEAPKFNIRIDPTAATPEFISNEIVEVVRKAAENASFIRIKYKNRNEQVSHRTLKNFEVIPIKEGASDVIYLVGHCLLRHDQRSFRVDRIQSIQTLELAYK